MEIDNPSLYGVQKRELEAFRQVRQWPTLLPAAGSSAPVDAQTQLRREEIVDYIRRDRATIATRPELARVPPAGAETPGGYQYGGQTGGGPRPRLANGDAWRSEVNQAIWAELGGREGGASAVNTWDRATVTLGGGFAAGGQLPEVMRRFFAADSGAAGAFLDMGFTLQNGHWLAVDLATGTVLADNAALQSIRNEPSVLSRFMNLAEDPVHGQNFVDAEWQTIRANAGDFPDAVRGWPVRTIVYVAHCVHWGGLTWPQWVPIGPDLAAIVRAQATHVARLDPDAWAGGGSLQILPVATSTFVTMAGGLARGVLDAPAPLPADIATGSYRGHIFLNATGNRFWHLAP
jgi:hypothetical protein